MHTIDDTARTTQGHPRDVSSNEHGAVMVTTVHTDVYAVASIGSVSRPWLRREIVLRGMILLALLLVAPFPPLTVSAATYTIANGDVAGLISAITAANGGGTNTISLAGNGTYTLTAANNTPATGANGLPVIAAGATIILNGNGATVQRSNASGMPNFRILSVNSGGNLQLNNLTIQRALVTAAASGGNGNGGAILNAGTLTVNNSFFTANGAFGANGAAGGAGGQANGGAIANNGTLTITNSTFDTNSSTGGSGGAGNAGGNGGGASGGAIANTGMLMITNSTFTRNSTIGGIAGGSTGNVPGGNGGNATGGTIASTAGSAAITNTTITGNQSVAGDEGIGVPDGTKGTGTGGAFGNSSGALTLTTTIIDRNLAGNSQAKIYNNCAGVSASNDGGHNLEYVPPVSPPAPYTCAFSTAAPKLDVLADPVLGAIGGYGGPTSTIPLLLGSAAINAGGSTCPSEVTADQRGQPRPQGGACDIGAFEYVPASNPALNATSGPTGGGPITFTGTFLQMGTVLTIDNVTATVLSVAADGTSLIANVPSHGPGVVSAFATDPGSLVGPTTTFTYIANLTITSISLASGLTGGGATVTIKGSGFGTSTTVTIGGAACTHVTILDDATLTCLTPAGTGVVDVAVTYATQTVTLSHGYTYGTVIPLPSPIPTAPSSGGSGPLPSTRPAAVQGSSLGTPNPLPPRR